MASAATHDQDGEGGKIIPASQRPDGTWRKPRRVKDGYVPQEEVPLYESKGKQFASRRNDGIPVGLTAEIVAAASKPKKGSQSSGNLTSPIPGLLVKVDKKKKNKKKKTGSEEITESLAKTSIEPPQPEPTCTVADESPTPSATSQADPTKRLKNLKKKLREIEMLEQKISSGELKNPEKDQLEKVAKKNEVVNEIASLESI